MRSIVEPGTGAVIRELKDTTPAGVNDAVGRARDASHDLAEMTPKQRSQMLFDMADVVDAAAEELVTLESIGSGKPRHELREHEWPRIVDPLRYYAGIVRAPHDIATDPHTGSGARLLRRDPVGVVGLLTPWGYPLMTATSKLAAILAAGNAAVIKPSALTPLSTLRLAELIGEVVPEGAVEVVCGGSEIGAQLASHRGIGLISATCRESTGRAIRIAAAQDLKRVQLEPAGNAPMIVCDDADLDRVVEAVRSSAYANAGQDRAAPCRLLVQRGVYRQLASALASRVSTLRRGPLTDPSTELGPLISAEHRDRVHGFVSRAAALDHTEVVAGGAPVDGPGFWYHPTLIIDTRITDEIVREAVFGPVVTMTGFVDPDHALDRANDGSNGGIASVWTRDLVIATRLGRRLNYDRVWINEHPVGRGPAPTRIDDFTITRRVILGSEF